MWEEIFISLYLLFVFVLFWKLSRALRNALRRMLSAHSRSGTYRRGMQQGFQKSVAEMARVVRNDQKGSSKNDIPRSPVPGVYECSTKDLEITDKKTGETFLQGDVSLSTLSIEFIQQSSTSSDGWTIRGRRSCPEKGYFSAIQEGFVSQSSGRAYWVERNSEHALLVCGYFQGDFFEGEWLSSNGNRGQYTAIHSKGIIAAAKADIDIPLGGVKARKDEGRELEQRLTDL